MQGMQVGRAGVQYDDIGFNATRKTELQRTSCVVATMATRGRMVQSSWPTLAIHLGVAAHLFGSV